MRAVDITKKGFPGSGLQKKQCRAENGAPTECSGTSPFAELFRPFAETMLFECDLSPMIKGAFASHLTARLAETLSPILYLTFTTKRAAAIVIDGHANGIYNSFIGELRQRTLKEAFSSYLLAQDVLERLSRQIISYAKEFAHNMAADWSLLEHQWKWAKETCLVSISPGQSDPHRRARTVIRLTFLNGKQLYYKPRSLKIDTIWSRVVDNFSKLGYFHLTAPVTVNRDIYGWSEGISAHPKFSRTDGEAYFYRFGCLICLAWLFDVSDLHPENIIPAQSGPVAVDLECIGHILGYDETQNLNRTGLLEGSPAESFVGTDIAWESWCSDQLRLLMVPTRLPQWRHPIPWLTRAQRDKLIARGFQETATIARANRGLVEDFREEVALTPRRHIYRPTVFYYHLLNALKSQQCMHSSEEWRKVTSAFLAGGEPTQIAAEQQQLADWDIPIFAAPQSKPRPVAWDLLSTRLWEQ